MTTDIQTTENQTLIPVDVSAAGLEAALAGDLSKMTGGERLKFYGALCEFTGLNPLSKPFDWLTFQNKLQLYPNKGCAEQLRQLRKINVDILERKVEFGCLIVRVKVTSGDGRHDESIGAVPFNEKMPPESIANAMMKCETKAKRRATFSICGLSRFVRDDIDPDAIDVHATAKIVNEAETAEDRAARMNAALTAGDKSDAVDIEATPERQPAQPITATDNAGTAAAGTQSSLSAPAGSTQAAEPMAPQVIPPASGQAPSSAPAAPSTSTPGVLTDSMVRELETVLGENKNSIPYLKAKNILTKDQGLEHLKPSNAIKIIQQPQAFFRAVDLWVASQSQPKA